MQASSIIKERKDNGRARVYLLLRAVQTQREDVVRILAKREGVVAVDRLEDQPDILAVMEAANRPGLAEAVVKALASVEKMIDDVKLLPVQNGVPVAYPLVSIASKASTGTRPGAVKVV